MPTRDLRSFLKDLEKKSELLHVAQEIDPCFEVSAFLHQFDQESAPALMFDKVKGYSGKIVGNLLGSRKRLEIAFDLKGREDLFETYQARRMSRIQPRPVSKAPVQQVVIKDQGKINLTALGIPTYHEADGGPYITCGILTAKDPASGLRSMGLHRLHVKGKRKMGVHLTNPPIAAFAAEAEKRGAALEVAVSLGVHPVILIASIVSSPREDKMALASSLLAGPVSMVQCKTIDVQVPADAEIIVEGKILPNIREPEGPFGETSGYYFSDDSHVIEVTAITHRRSPIVQALHPMAREVLFLAGPAGEAEMIRMLRDKGFDVRELVVTHASNRTHVVVSLRKGHDADPHQLLHFLLAGVPYIKHAVVVDEDVNVRDAGDVEWAVATRFQADRDLIVIPHMRARSIDPSSREGNFMTKLGFDATVPLSEKERYKRIGVPAAVSQKVAQMIRGL
ncbi:MAG: UbiD family decarboxylase [Desulfobacterales bacterium]|nr:UbiD family decarboxylase [Desulfobacterales bacterium]